MDSKRQLKAYAISTCLIFLIFVLLILIVSVAATSIGVPGYFFASFIIFLLISMPVLIYYLVVKYKILWWYLPLVSLSPAVFLTVSEVVLGGSNPVVYLTIGFLTLFLTLPGGLLAWNTQHERHLNEHESDG